MPTGAGQPPKDAATHSGSMTQVRLELPDAVCSLLQCAPGTLDQELRLAAAIQWYQQGRISQEWAARIAGMDRPVIEEMMIAGLHLSRQVMDEALRRVDE